MGKLKINMEQISTQYFKRSASFNTFKRSNSIRASFRKIKAKLNNSQVYIKLEHCPGSKNIKNKCECEAENFLPVKTNKSHSKYGKGSTNHISHSNTKDLNGFRLSSTNGNCCH